MDVIELKKIANEVRKGIVTSVHSAKAGHPGGSLSAADVFTYLYFEEMNIDPRDPKKADRDRFVLSKGHTAPALYAALAERGYFPREDLKTFRHIDSYLQGHPDMKGTPGVDMTTVKFVELDGRKLLDGGCTDSVPVEAFRKLGFRRNVVVLTRDLEYRKKPENTWMADLVYHKYPKFAEALKNRAVQYNRSIRNIEKLEKDWLEYPVLHLDLNAEKFDSPERLDALLSNQLTQWEELYGRGQDETTLSYALRSDPQDC